MNKAIGVPKASSFKIIEPSPDIVRVVTNVDYSTDAAIADIIDNSVDAEATHVLVRVVGTPEKIDHILIVDNGKGMSSSEIDNAMSFGRRRNYGDSDLGLYGMGLKSASLSQCPVLTVFSKATGSKAVGRQWSTVSALDGWKCGVIEEFQATDALQGPWITGLSTTKKGTVIRWDDVKIFRQAKNRVDEYVIKFFRSLETYLGMVFHRRLSDGRLKITLDYLNTENQYIGVSKVIGPLDPFAYPKPGDKNFPVTFKVKHGGVQLQADAHIWPKVGKSNPNYLLIGNIAQRQGLYFYRNDRLIQAGGWNGLRMDGEPHLSLARVSIDLSSKADDDFSVRFTKASIEVPYEFVEKLRKAVDPQGVSFNDYIGAAHDVYRIRGEQKVSALHPVSGIDSKAKVIAKDAFGFSKGDTFKVRIGRISAKNQLFDLDLDGQQLILNKSILDRASVDELKESIKLLTYLLIQTDFKMERQSAKKAKTILAFAKMSAAVFKPDGGR
jgi:hypothetical protein